MSKRLPDALPDRRAVARIGGLRAPSPLAPAPMADAQHAALRQVGQLLAGVRAAAGLSLDAFSARLNTGPAVVAALERGDLDRLPPWQQTRRIVDQWLAGAGLDPRPALASIEIVMQMSQGLPQPARQPAPAGQGASGRQRDVPRKPAQAPHVETAEEPREKARMLRKAAHLAAQLPATVRPSPWRIAIGLPPSRFARWSALVLMLAALATTATQSTVVAGALAKLPAPAERAVRSISDFFAVRFAPLREGHRWIEVADPRSRRGDKLRIGRHSD